MVTLKDIAEIANVNPSTVSRAFNNTGNVHPETKKRIFEVAEQLSYHPLRIKSVIKQGKTNTIGVIVPSIQMNIFAGLVEEIELAANEHGYGVLIATTQDSKDLEKKALNRFVKGFTDGIIIASTGQNKQLIRDINESHVPVLQMIRDNDSELPSMSGDYYQCAFDATEHLILQGNRNIGLINGRLSCEPFKIRYLGYINAMKKYGLLRKLNYIDKKIESDYDNGFNGVDILLKKNPKLDGIVIANDVQGIGVLNRLKEKGLKVPDDIRVISLTENPINSLLETGLSTMSLEKKEMSLEAIEYMTKLINSRPTLRDNNSSENSPPKKPFPFRRELYSFKLVKKESSGQQ